MKSKNRVGSKAIQEKVNVNKGSPISMSEVPKFVSAKTLYGSPTTSGFSHHAMFPKDLTTKLPQFKLPMIRSPTNCGSTQKQNSTPEPLVANLRSSPIQDKLYFAPLPFYDIQQVIMEPRILSAQRNGGTIIKFEIPLDISRKLAKSTVNPLPRYEIQLRFTSTNSGNEQLDVYPRNLTLSLNALQINLPNAYKMSPTQSLFKPVDLTSYVRGRNQKLLIKWSDNREFSFGIWFVQHINTTMQRDKLLAIGPSFYEETREQVKFSLGGNSDDISMDSLKVSLLCPLSRTKLVTPVRSRLCRHFNCFDLLSFLSLHEERPNWKCPICNSQISYNSLVVDRYFLKIIDSSGDANEIELLPNGDWKMLNKKKLIEYEVDEEAVGHNAGRKKVKKEEITFITIDDEETAVSLVGGQESRKREYTQISAVDYEIITLDEED